MTQPIDTAYVDIVARDKSLDKLRKDIDKTFNDIDKDISKTLDEIDDRFEETFVEIDTHFQTMTIRSKHAFDDVGDDAIDALERIQKTFQIPLEAGLVKLTDLLTDTSRIMGQLGSAVGGAVSSSPLLALILALAPAIIALAAALSNLIGLVGVLPAGLGVILAALIPLIVAFQNFGTAVSAIADGDLEKIDEALKKLAPSARLVAREIGAFLPFLREFQRGLQEAFFSQITGAFSRMLSVLPAIRTGLESVLISIGKFVSALSGFIAAPQTIMVLNTLLQGTARIISTLTGPFLKFGDMIGRVIVAGLPFVERFAGALGRLLERFSAFVNTSIENGDFDAFVEKSIVALKELLELAGAVGGLLKTLFAGTDQAGLDFIQTLTDLTIRLDNFLKSADGQATIDALVLSVQALGLALGSILNVLTFNTSAVFNFLRMLEKIGEETVKFVEKVIEWFGKVPEAVETFFAAIPARVEAIFQSTIDNALRILGIGIGLIMFVITELPNQIGAVLTSLPQRIHDWLVSIGPIVATIFEGAVNFGRNFVVNGFNEIVEFIRSVPDRIRELIPTFGGAGRSLIQSFMNGFRAVGGFIGDVAGDIVGAVKGFLNRAIDRINSGIATIDAILPGDLGRIPRLAQGAFVPRRPGGILANIGEGTEDEWVLPQSKLDALTQSGSITFLPDSINVNFSGVVPTEDEARQTGMAVGQGILDMISKRNVQVQVRAI